MACSKEVSGSSHNELLHLAVSLVLKDDGFSLPSPPAQRARKTAESLLEWSDDSENKLTWRAFADELIHSLEGCFREHRSVRAQREQMWESYHKLRLSKSFKDMWTILLQQRISSEPCPIFFQFVTDTVIEELIKRHFHVEVVEKEHEASLDYEERNALRYTAGYVTRALIKKLKRAAHPMRKELILWLTTLTEEDIGGEDVDDSEEWTNSVDRGGLKHVNNMTYMLFVEMELVLR